MQPKSYDFSYKNVSVALMTVIRVLENDKRISWGCELGLGVVSKRQATLALW